MAGGKRPTIRPYRPYGFWEPVCPHLLLGRTYGYPANLATRWSTYEVQNSSDHQVPTWCISRPAAAGARRRAAARGEPPRFKRGLSTQWTDKHDNTVTNPEHDLENPELSLRILLRHIGYCSVFVSPGMPYHILLHHIETLRLLMPHIMSSHLSGLV